MKKFAKMSLVAAIAVAGLTSTATAGSLEEAIKGVNISGFVEYRSETTVKTTADVAEENSHDIDVRLTAVIPVNDMVNATIRFDETADEDSDDGVLDADPIAFDMDRIYFTYLNNGLSSSFGLIGAPLTDGGSADGVTVSKTVNGISLTGGYLTSTSATTADEVVYASISGSAASIAYNATYAVVNDSEGTDTLGTAADGAANALHAGLSTTVEGFNVAVNYGSLSDKAGQEDQSQVKVSASTTVGAVNLGLAYASNDKNGGETMLDGSDAAASEISIGAIELSQEGNASALLATVSMALGEKGTGKIRYATTSNDAANSDINVLRVNYDHQMSSNFKVYAEYTANDDDSFATKASDYVIGAKYTF